MTSSVESPQPRTARRTLFSGALALLALPPCALAQDAPEVEAARRAILGGATPEPGGIRLLAPAMAEHGGQVPITIQIDSPQTPALYVQSVHVLATRNPTPGVVEFRLTPYIARAELQTRIRLAEGQRVLVLARMSDGRFREAAAEIAVGTGGCLT
ncbi:MAG: thiosulfate oxidation carrier protein SoxY [Rhodovarius sp.]|nr:thiosulfate oxidation carrier protein SoxY [Rhodovarius sp.]